MFFKWIKEHKLISILAVAFIALVLVIGLTRSSGGATRLGALDRLYMLIEQPMTSLGQKIKENVSGIFSYKKLLAENEALREENEELRNEINQLTFTAIETQELQELSEALNYDFVQGGRSIVTANIVSQDSSNWTNSFVIDKGLESGIKVDNIVICGKGLVGRVSATDEGWSKIIPIIDESSSISFYIEGTTNMLGIIEGSESGKLTGFMLDNTVEIAEGDRLITSGIGLFPEGIAIGKVTRAGYDSDKQLVTLDVKAEVDFGSIGKVSVIL